MAKFRTTIRYPHTANPASMTPRQVAKTYNFPPGFTGKGYVGGIIELGGGFDPSQVTKYFISLGLPRVPKLTSVGVSGGRNKSDGPDGADGEVQLDICVAGAIAYDAELRVYFAPNTDTGFLAAIRQARKDGCRGISISWGGPEDTWGASTLAAFEQELFACRAAGVPVFCASGDTGSRDGTGHPVVDFPASAPHAVGCGGTRLTLDAAGKRAAEVVWNDSPTSSATGGGVSKAFPGRDVPDVAGNADPNTGYDVAVDGQRYVIGGTSAVAPLMLGLHALLWELDQANGAKGFDFLNLIVTNPQSCFDVTSGNNGDFRAGPGRDQTTGFGVPDGGLLAAALTNGIPAPAPPTPTPTPVPGPGPIDPMSDFPVKTVSVWGQHKHNHSAIESAAYTALADWAQSHGVSLPA